MKTITRMLLGMAALGALGGTAEAETLYSLPITLAEGVSHGACMIANLGRENRPATLVARCGSGRTFTAGPYQLRPGAGTHVFLECDSGDSFTCRYDVEGEPAEFRASACDYSADGERICRSAVPAAPAVPLEDPGALATAPLSFSSEWLDTELHCEITNVDSRPHTARVRIVHIDGRVESSSRRVRLGPGQTLVRRRGPQGTHYCRFETAGDKRFFRASGCLARRGYRGCRALLAAE